MSITIHKDLRGEFGPARDQDPRPTCMAFAASDAHAGARPGWTPLSVEWAYYFALQREGVIPHTGVHLATMLDTLRNDGQPIETVWPYDASLFTDFDAWKPPTAVSIFTRSSMPVVATVEGILAALDDDRPVLFTMSVSKAFFSPSPEGVVASTEPLDPARVHALVAVGHGKWNASPVILVRNSWGERWGLGGHAWIDLNYLTPRLKVAATMTKEP